MRKIAFDKILDICIKMLVAGKSVSDCLKKYPKIRGLKQALAVAKIAVEIPKKSLTLDKNLIWNKIESGIKKSQEIIKTAATNSQAQTTPFGAFRLAFPKAIFTLATIVIIVGLVNATAVAAKNSLPGETLYPIKRTVEKVELVLTVNEEKKTEKKIKHAENRLYEAQQIVEQKAPEENETLTEEESKIVEKTITELVESTEEIASESENNKVLLEQVVLLTDEQEEILAEIKPKVTGETKEVVEDAIVAASESKVEAEENLAALEEESAEKNSADETATSTEEILEGSAEGTVDENGSGATTTEDVLEVLGNPQASSTEILLPLSTNDSNTSSTLEIIDLR